MLGSAWTSGQLMKVANNTATSANPTTGGKGHRKRSDAPGHFWGVSRMWSVLAALDDLNNLTLIDVGAGDGSISAIAAQKYSLGSIRAYDVQLVNDSWVDLVLFDGQHIPEKDASADIVLFAYVLHHAASSTHALLREAARIARRWVLVSEDLDALEWRGRNTHHDMHAHFRDEASWRDQFASAGLRVIASGPMFDMDHPCHYFLLRHANAPRLRTPINARAQSAAFSKLMQHGLVRGLRQGQLSIDR